MVMCIANSFFSFFSFLAGWVNMDDSNIFPTDLRTLSSNTVYLLFYQMVSTKKT